MHWFRPPPRGPWRIFNAHPGRGFLVIDLAKLASLPPAKQQAWLRRHWVKPFIERLLRSGVRLHVLVNAMAAELSDLEQLEDEERN